MQPRDDQKMRRAGGYIEGPPTQQQQTLGGTCDQRHNPIRMCDRSKDFAPGVRDTNRAADLFLHKQEGPYRPIDKPNRSSACPTSVDV